MSTPEIPQTDFFELGDKTCLICSDPGTAEIVRNTVKELGFKTRTVESVDAAIDRMRYTTFNCIMLQETFAGSTLKTNTVLRFLASLPMAQRRNSFICLIGESFKTLDAMQAFAQSVHLVVNPSDMANMTAILKKGLAEFEIMYRVYRIAMEMQIDRRAGGFNRRASD
jgi:hypothetical protein